MVYIKFFTSSCEPILIYKISIKLLEKFKCYKKLKKFNFLNEHQTKSYLYIFKIFLFCFNTNGLSSINYYKEVTTNDCNFFDIYLILSFH